MRTLTALLASAFCVILLPATSFSQTQNKNNTSVGCVDASIRIQAELMKREFVPQGFDVIKNAMISMTSKKPFPVEITFEKGKQYHIMFIGSKDASNMSFELFDGNDVKIDSRQMDDPSTNNVIHYSFMPEQTSAYLLVLTQKLKNKDLCGSITVMQKSDNKPSVAEQKETPISKKAPAKAPVKKK